MSERAPVFRLQRVLNHREDEERARTRELALALADLEAQSTVLSSACACHADALERMSRALGAGRVPAAQLSAIHADVERAATTVHRATEAREYTGTLVEERRRRLVLARQAREVMERLRSRHLLRARQEEGGRAQAMMDDFAALSHRRAKTSATPPDDAYTSSIQTSKDVLM